MMHGRKNKLNKIGFVKVQIQKIYFKPFNQLFKNYIKITLHLSVVRALPIHEEE